MNSAKFYLLLLMTEKPNLGEASSTRKKYAPAFKTKCVRQVAYGARQTGVARTQGISPALLGRWPRQAPEQAVPSSAELRRAEMECTISKESRDHIFPTASVVNRY